MGADGGTIPTRDELVKVKKKDVKEDPSIKWAAKWKHCAVSSQPLREPIVACELGQLFNKEDLMKALLAIKDKSMERPAELKHVKKLKDVHELNLRPVTHSSSSSSTRVRGVGLDDDQEVQFECPITGVPMNGRHRFVYPVTCGCVISERALREIPTATCLVCSKPFTAEDIVVLNPEQEEMKEMALNMKARRERAKAAKKAAKSAGAPAPSSSSSSSAAQQAVAGEDGDKDGTSAGNGFTREEMERFRREAEVIKRRARHADEQKRKQAKVNGGKPAETSATADLGLDSDALKWALSSKSVAQRPGASDTMKKLFHSSSKRDMNQYKTFTSRTGYSMSHTWG
ncbi:hypothetical protein PTSG_06927 [Salpingoeca rosetta]|uniref:Uncharacterized protein n=1 Tax=Salpingoeca rosetta (strain ATCC 50818 / BSB-021) TaxID=946362 RepID=F2UF74_SALR5|nr:uncharacterized protein PTSG_06927 [Salpingoeca rosetta]EGD75274.1 hypothetical protein PTSG_06927 [Salpingoeca rosetta]|eukprot:XP_004992327.1 hypothetical protein PTSG_06927 [Salpingoeca rosetta]